MNKKPRLEKESKGLQDKPSSDMQEISNELKDALRDIPEEKKKELLTVFKQYDIRRSFAGPIPPPEILQGYDKCIKNGAERVLKMAENQSAHRLQLEDHAVKEQLKQSRRGQDYGFAMGVICIIASVTLAIFGHDTIAGIIGGSTIIGLVTVFIIGKKQQANSQRD